MIKYGYLGSDGTVYRLPSQGEVVSYMDEEFVVDAVDGDVASLINESSENDVALVVLSEEVELRATEDAGMFIGGLVILGEVNEGVIVSDEFDDVFLLEEVLDERVSKDSNPREGFVFRRKKSNRPVYVVAVYPDEEKVSFWDDEARRYSWDIEKFKNEMKPGKEEDYDIFESLESLNESRRSEKIIDAVLDKIEKFRPKKKLHWSDDGEELTQKDFVGLFYPDYEEEVITIRDGYLQADDYKWLISELKKYLGKAASVASDGEIFVNMEEASKLIKKSSGSSTTTVEKTYVKGKKFFVDAVTKKGPVTYEYECLNGLKPAEVKKKFDGWMKHSPGKGWQYLRTNCKLVSQN